jgi:hypothetical protein
MFADPWNPSITEVRAWAYDAAAEEPCQDWDLALCWAGHERDYLDFASDRRCPKRAFFLSVIYLMVGDAVRSEFRSTSEAMVSGFVQLGANHSDPAIRLWHSRASHLLDHPKEFEYDAWCAGKLARDDA